MYISNKYILGWGNSLTWLLHGFSDLEGSRMEARLWDVGRVTREAILYTFLHHPTDTQLRPLLRVLQAGCAFPNRWNFYNAPTNVFLPPDYSAHLHFYLFDLMFNFHPLQRASPDYLRVTPFYSGVSLYLKYIAKL